MDPVTAIGLVGTIVGFYSTCRDIYVFCADVKNASKEVLTQARQFAIQESILKAWGFYWEINRHQLHPVTVDGTVHANLSSKLTEYLQKNPYKGEGIANALYCIADTLSDWTKLREKYGFVVQEGTKEVIATPGVTCMWFLKPALTSYPYLPLQIETEDLGLPLEPRLARVATGDFKNAAILWKGKATQLHTKIRILNRCRWALVDKDSFNSLIVDLKGYNDALYTLCPDYAIQVLQINLVSDYLHNDKTGLKMGLLKDKDGEEDLSQSQQGLKVVVDMVKIKAAVKDTQQTSMTEADEKELLNITLKALDFKTDNMAVYRDARQVVYAESHSYSIDGEPHGERSLNARRKILKLGRLIRNPLCSRRLLVLELLGLAEDTERREIKFVYKLPKTLGRPQTALPLGDTSIRRGRALFYSRPGDTKSSLGWRFELARKLVRSVIFLHAAGWLHGNIRSDSVLFFPKPGGQTITREPGGMDMESPLLLGFQFSRPSEMEAQDGGRPRSRSLDRTRPPDADTPEISMHARHQPSQRPDQGIRHWAAPLMSHANERELAMWNLRKDVRHHPTKRLDPRQEPCYAFDVYSLGILLLEIALDTHIDDLLADQQVFDGYKPEGYVVDEEFFNPDIWDPFDVRREIIKLFTPRLKHECGDIFTKVIVDCLNVEPEESPEGLNKQREMCIKVAADLAYCQA